MIPLDNNIYEYLRANQILEPYNIIDYDNNNIIINSKNGVIPEKITNRGKPNEKRIEKKENPYDFYIFITRYQIPLFNIYNIDIDKIDSIIGENNKFNSLNDLISKQKICSDIYNLIMFASYIFQKNHY